MSHPLMQVHEVVLSVALTAFRGGFLCGRSVSWKITQRLHRDRTLHRPALQTYSNMSSCLR
jgi:hypothetical protein